MCVGGGLVYRPQTSTAVVVLNNYCHNACLFFGSLFQGNAAVHNFRPTTENASADHFLLHFATAPFAIIPPFKLGEIVRFYTLWTISRKLSETIVTVLLDRLFDAIILSLLLAWLIINDHIDSVMDESTRTVQWMILAVTISAGVCFLIGPRALSSLQRYVMIHHSGRNVLVSLRLIDVLRKGTTSGEGLLRQQGPLLMMITVLIWGLELVAAALFTPWQFFQSSIMRVSY